MAELIPTKDEADWLRARQQGITASEIAVVMGLSPWSSPYALYHQKLGILPPVEDNAAMERGRVLEPYIALKFAEAHPELVMRGNGRDLFRNGPWQMATPDRLICEGPYIDTSSTARYPKPIAVLEIKTASDMSDWGEPGTDEIPVHYRAQVLWQMDVMEVSKAHVAVLDIPRWRVLEYVIEHAEGCGPGHNMLAYPSLSCAACDDIVMMRDAGREFLERIERQDPPDVDWRPATAYALKQLHPSLEDRDAHIGRQLEISYRAAVRRYREAEQRRDEMTNRLRAAMGSARRAVAAGTVGKDGERIAIATRQVYEVRESVRKAYTVDKIVAASPKTKKES